MLIGDRDPALKLRRMHSPGALQLRFMSTYSRRTSDKIKQTRCRMRCGAISMEIGVRSKRAWHEERGTKEMLQTVERRNREVAVRATEWGRG
jgi:hypothetical protein